MGIEETIVPLEISMTRPRSTHMFGVAFEKPVLVHESPSFASETLRLSSRLTAENLKNESPPFAIESHSFHTRSSSHTRMFFEDVPRVSFDDVEEIILL